MATKFLFNFIYIFGAATLTVPPSQANHSAGLSRDLPSITSLVFSPPSANKSAISLADPPSVEISFSLPLIHQTSPLSPFYNPNVSEGEIFRENLRISRERAQYMYLKRAPGTSLFQIPVSHDFVILYSIGTPPVETYGVPDTGSDLVWLQCEPCQTCYDQTTTRFDSRESSTYEVVECDSSLCSGFKNKMTCDDDGYCAYGVRYVDGSYSRGNIAEEIITVASQHSTRRIALLIGCGFSNMMKSGKKYPSVVGLQNSERSLIGQIRSPAFSFCHDNKNNGSFQVGRFTARLWGKSTSLVPNYEGMYLVRLEDIMVNDEGLNMPYYVFEHVTGNPGDETSGVVIDSGAGVTHLHPTAFDALLAKISAHMEKKGKSMSYIWGLYCWDNPGGVGDPSLPTISFIFLDIKLRLGRNAWRQEGRYTCLMIARFPRRFTIIGRYQLRNINVGFDLKNMKLWLEVQSECVP
ncbi:aspartic proteinase CDR1-like [Rhododendron vialii]|uniref:aspartic proteinase CDR1-like n=1 Tax=Rhododendron vialii TaxID=182163 RepID=UPI00265E6923|nr:aspartic proteinase CDR1-like [Rhododendron vialii]